jgi:protein-serine/threonine kinase
VKSRRTPQPTESLSTMAQQQQQQQQQLSPRSHPVLLEQDHHNNNKARSNGKAAASTPAGTSFLLSPQPLLVSSTASSTSSTTPGPALDTSVAQLRPQHLAPTDPATINNVASSPHSPSLRLQTKGLRSTGAPRRVVSSSSSSSGTQQQLQHPAIPEEMDGSFSDNLSPSRARSTSVSSCYSPGADPINQMTPLPSPLASCDSPGPWNQFRTLSRNPSLTGRTTPAPPRAGTSALVTASGESLDAALAAQNQRKAHQNYRPPAPQPQFSFNSANAPKLDFESTLPIPIRRSLSKNGHERSPSLPAFDSSTRLHREKHLAQRRRTLSSADSSPYLSGSVTSLSSVSSIETALDPEDRNLRLIKKQKLESFEARSIKDDKIRRWRGLRLLGQGAFSKVILATSDDIPDEVDHVHDEGVVVDDESVTLNPRKYVAVKIVEHGAAGAESKERVESGLKRELDILKTVHHPCLVRLKAFSIEPSRALLVLNFCAGGDLFDVADTFQLAPRLIQRMFAEIVSALRYLHQNGIVHRDVKLESMTQSLLLQPIIYPHFSVAR